MTPAEKYIFLDFDGVLNTEYYQNLLYYQGEPLQDGHGAYFDPEAVAQLRRIIDITDAAIVVESSWKYLGLEAMRELWSARNLPGKIVGITPSSVSDQWLLTNDFNDSDPSVWHCKGLEIASWLTDNATDDARYVIIDDEYVILESQQSYFLLTNPYDGITEEVADRAISLLNR